MWETCGHIQGMHSANVWMLWMKLWKWKMPLPSNFACSFGDDSFFPRGREKGIGVQFVRWKADEDAFKVTPVLFLTLDWKVWALLCSFKINLFFGNFTGKPWLICAVVDCVECNWQGQTGSEGESEICVFAVWAHDGTFKCLNPRAWCRCWCDR